MLSILLVAFLTLTWYGAQAPHRGSLRHRSLGHESTWVSRLPGPHRALFFLTYKRPRRSLPGTPAQLGACSTIDLRTTRHWTAGGGTKERLYQTARQRDAAHGPPQRGFLSMRYLGSLKEEQNKYQRKTRFHNFRRQE